MAGQFEKSEMLSVALLLIVHANNIPTMQFLIGIPRTSQSKCDTRVWYYWLSVLGKGSHNYPLLVEQFITWLLSIYRFVDWRVKHSMCLLEDLSILARLRTIDLTISVIVKTTYQNRFNTSVQYLFGREKFCWLLEQSCLMTVESFNWSQYVYCK